MVSCLKNWAVESMASRAQHSVLLVLLLMLLESSSQVDLAPPVLSCPESCRCAHPLKANCSSGSWRSFPLGLNPEVRILHMTNNSILKLDNNTFLITHLPYLNVMYLQRNRINFIHRMAFQELKHLRFLYLDRNRITTFDTDVFSDNKRLEVLGLSFNPLRFPNRGPFLKSTSLQMLDMSHCNISRLPKETFVALSALEELRLSYNSLTQLDADLFMFLQNLKYLYMSNNNLSYIPQDLFMYSEFLQVLDISQNKLKELESNLTELYLQNNSIEAIENDVFGSTANLRLLYLDNNSMENITREALASLESLSHLYISNNHLRTFHMRLVCDLPSLKYLRVYGNPMSCSCELKTLWEWAMYRGIQLWGSCTPEGSDEVLSNSSVASALVQLTCNQTSCALETVIEKEDTFLLLVYILSGVCPLVLVIICSILTVCAFKNHRKNVQEQEVSYNMTTSSTGYLMQEHMAPGQMYSSDELQNVENCDYAMQATPVKECTHVSPYSVSPVLYSNDNAGVAHCPPPIPAMPPKELLSNSPYAVPLGYVREPPAPVRGRAFSTSEEEESRPLMRPHHGGTLPAASRSSSFRTRQTARRLRPRRQLGNLSSDTEPWSSYSEDASDTVSVTQCEMATWSGSEASTHVVSENNVDTMRA
ncbi:Protein artichoke [Gryllus bimaculatus]|nr:Protein artichoke [Gryllus bimaculatus]